MNRLKEMIAKAKPRIMGIQDYQKWAEEERKQGEPTGRFMTKQNLTPDANFRRAFSIMEKMEEEEYQRLVAQVEYNRLPLGQKSKDKIDGKTLRRVEDRIRKIHQRKIKEKQENRVEAERRWAEQRKPWNRFGVLAQVLSKKNKAKILKDFSLSELKEIQGKMVGGQLPPALKVYSPEHNKNVLNFLSSAIQIKS